MAKSTNNIQEMLANTDTLEFPKMKIDFTNDVDKVLISSDVEDEPLKISMENTELNVSSLVTDRLILCGVDVTDDILELFLKNSQFVKKVSKLA